MISIGIFIVSFDNVHSATHSHTQTVKNKWLKSVNLMKIVLFDDYIARLRDSLIASIQLPLIGFSIFIVFRTQTYYHVNKHTKLFDYLSDHSCSSFIDSFIHFLFLIQFTNIFSSFWNVHQSSFFVLHNHNFHANTMSSE